MSDPSAAPVDYTHPRFCAKCTQSSNVLNRCLGGPPNSPPANVETRCLSTDRPFVVTVENIPQQDTAQTYARSTHNGGERRRNAAASNGCGCFAWRCWFLVNALEVPSPSRPNTMPAAVSAFEHVYSSRCKQEGVFEPLKTTECRCDYS